MVNGHYEFCLLLRDNMFILTKNHTMVISRLKSLQKKLKMNPTFHNDYKKLMLTLLQNGVEEVVQERELFRNDGMVYVPPKET